MRLFAKVFTVSAVLTALSLSSALAVLTVTLYDTPYNDYSGGGGEFSAVATGGPNFINNYSPLATYNSWTTAKPRIGFETFCIEYSEHISFGVTYTATVSDGAKSGGSTGGGISPIVGGKDKISKGTAWLYSQFAAGTLTGYYYNTTLAARQTSSRLLQEAIWGLEGERTWNASNPFLVLVTSLSLFGSQAGAAADANGAYGVAALNLYTASGGAQDQLVIVPEPTTVIAGALLLLPFGASTLRILRRNRR